MEKSDIDYLIEDARAWLHTVSEIQRIAELGMLEDLEKCQKKREDTVRRYQSRIGSLDYSGCSPSQLQSLETLLKSIQQCENVLAVQLQEYQHQLVEALHSVNREGALHRKYGLDGT